MHHAHTHTHNPRYIPRTNQIWTNSCEKCCIVLPASMLSQLLMQCSLNELTALCMQETVLHEQHGSGYWQSLYQYHYNLRYWCMQILILYEQLAVCAVHLTCKKRETNRFSCTVLGYNNIKKCFGDSYPHLLKKFMNTLSSTLVHNTHTSNLWFCTTNKCFH